MTQSLLIVDDNAELLETYDAWFGSKGFQVQTLCTRSREDALAVILAAMPDAVLLDGVLQRGRDPWCGPWIANALIAQGFSGKVCILSGETDAARIMRLQLTEAAQGVCRVGEKVRDNTAILFHLQSRRDAH